MLKLKAEKRELKGKKTKRLRAEGLLPANIYGKGVASEAVQVSLEEFNKTFDEAGETGLVELLLGKEKRPVLIGNAQKSPVGGEFLHVDFRQVNLKEKITSSVPIALVGVSPAEKNGLGIVVQSLHEVEVEALPADLPESFEVDISKLEKVDDGISIGDLKVGKKLEVLTDKERRIVSVVAPREEKEEEKETPGEVEVTAEKKEEGEQKQELHQNGAEESSENSQ